MTDLGNPAAKHTEGEDYHRRVDDAGDDNVAWDIDAAQSSGVLVDVCLVGAPCRKMRDRRRH